MDGSGMRRQLVMVFVALSMMVTTAFVLPLGFLVRRTAEDRALDQARVEAAVLLPVLDADVTQQEIEAAMATTRSGLDGRMTVLTSDGLLLGVEPDPPTRVDLALTEGRSSTGSLPGGGAEVVIAVAAGPDLMSAVRVEVTEDALRRGQWRAWITLAAVGVGLVAISVLVADRLARSLVVPAQDLVAGARRLGAGDLDTRVQPGGPQELVELAGAFNDLGTRISSMLVRERELVAELSHRLRTPLTALRLRTDLIADPELAADLRADIDAVTDVVTNIIQEARGAVPESRLVDLAEAVTERVAFWQVLADDQERPWTFESGERPLWIAARRGDIDDVIDVLIENAFAHTAESVPLLVGFGRHGAMAEFWVGDGGEGIDPDLVDRGSSSSGSTGLGLDIARRVLSEAGGDLHIGTSSLGGALLTGRVPLSDLS